MAYGTVAGVAERVPGLRLGQTNAPSEYQVEQWLGEAAAWIDRSIGAAGYVAPAASTAALYPELVALAEQYAAAQALRARALDSSTGLPEERSNVWMTEIRQRLAEFAGAGLEGMGLPPIVTPATSGRRLRSVQMRRIDGYSRWAEGGYGEYSGVMPPSD